MNRRIGLRAALAVTSIAGLALLAAGCTDARVTNVWSDPSRGSVTARSLLVVSQRKDATQRRLWEDAVREQLLRSGVNAVASYSLFPDGVPGQKALGQAIEDQHLDAAIVLKPLTATQETSWVPGWRSVQPREYYNPWSGRDRIVYTSRWHPGYSVTDRTLREQVTVWTPDDGGRMIWAATVESTNPGSQDAFRHDIAGGVVPGLKKARVIV